MAIPSIAAARRLRSHTRCKRRMNRSRRIAMACAFQSNRCCACCSRCGMASIRHCGDVRSTIFRVPGAGLAALIFAITTARCTGQSIFNNHFCGRCPAAGSSSSGSNDFCIPRLGGSSPRSRALNGRYGGGRRTRTAAPPLSATFLDVAELDEQQISYSVTGANSHTPPNRIVGRCPLRNNFQAPTARFTALYADSLGCRFSTARRASSHRDRLAAHIPHCFPMLTAVPAAPIWGYF